MTKPTLPTLPLLTEEQTKNLESVYPKLANFINAFDSVLSVQFSNDLKEIDETFKNVFNERWQAAQNMQEQINNQKSEILEQIAEDNKLNTKWEVAEIGPNNFEDSFSLKPVKCLIFEETKIKFEGGGKNLTWLEAWKHADNLISQSDNTNLSIIQFHEVIPKSGFFTIIIKN